MSRLLEQKTIYFSRWMNAILSIPKFQTNQHVRKLLSFGNKQEFYDLKNEKNVFVEKFLESIEKFCPECWNKVNTD